MYCYLIGMIFLILTPYFDCGDANLHLISNKTWVIGFSIISCIQLLKEVAKKRIVAMHEANTITYRTRSRILVGMTVAAEVIHFLWQVYGNILFYGQSADTKVQECQDTKNPGIKWVMLMLIIFGYFFFVIYCLVLTLLGGLYTRRFLSQRNRVS